MAVISLSSLHAEAARSSEDDDPDMPRIGQRWVSRIDPWHGVPSSLALRFGRAAIGGGLTPSAATSLLNDARFVAAVGAPDQGWGLLEAMIDEPAAIVDAYLLLQEWTDYTSAGATSFQYAFLSRHLELRNAYLADLGHMIAVRSDGAEVLVDIGTGRQIIGRDLLGVPIRAPGGAPLLRPSISPEDAAAQMWEEIGADPNDLDLGPVAAASPPGAPTGPGLDVKTESSDPGLVTPGIYLVAAAFLMSWLGFGAVMVVRRLRKP
jgi:hypothetical protein